MSENQNKESAISKDNKPKDQEKKQPAKSVQGSQEKQRGESKENKNTKKKVNATTEKTSMQIQTPKESKEIAYGEGVPVKQVIANPQKDAIEQKKIDSIQIKTDNRIEERKKETTDGGKEEKQEKVVKTRPDSVSLKDKSEQFKRIIDIALEYERVEEERNRLKVKNKDLSEECKKLSENLNESKKLCDDRRNEISELQSELSHRNEVIDIVKADKNESAQEYKNALAAALKTFYADYSELKAMEMSDEVGAAMADTLEDVFKVLEKNGITVTKQ